MTPTAFCQHVENRLGWVPPHNRYRPWQTYMAEASKVSRQIATNPELYTWDNLLLAVELLVRERQPRTPIGVFAHVERAVELAREHEDDLEEQIRKVVAYEIERGDPQGWAGRFARASGHYRYLALEEWKFSVQ